MPIPPQNDFLVPFLTCLSEGKTLTRAQLLYQLAQHFHISQAEAQQMSGNQFTLVSRLAWCDAHFVKAGFVEKRQHHSDSAQDQFTITSLGLRELHRNAPKITVGYLQSFYRGRIHRGAGSDDTTSEAERALYEAFENLPDAYTIFHSVKWFAKSRGSIGEIDFLIAHPSRGVLILEVKGGLISLDQGTWYSTGYTGRTVEIHDPCKQASRNRDQLYEWIKEDSRTSRYNYALFPAVALPDSVVGRDLRPDCPEDIFIDMRHLDELPSRIEEIFAYWASHADGRAQKMDGSKAIDALVDLLVPTRKLQPRIADLFERERRKIDELTQQQFFILRALRYQKRAAIVGGAGTGKTLLAMEKTQQLLDQGCRVLFLCFNRNLQTWLDKSLKHPKLVVTTFHGLAGHAVNWARIPRPPSASFYEQAPELLLSAAQVLQSEHSDKLFDAIIVDEAQDFEDTWWIPLPDLLTDPQEGIFYVFFDNNQRIYTQISNIPMSNEPLFLDENRRNTQHIHAALTPYMQTHEETTCLGPEGRPVEHISASTPAEAHKALQQTLHRLVNEEGVSSDDIILLTGASDKRSQWKSDTQLGNFILTWDLDTEMDLAIRICSIATYKGLESAVIILTELDQCRPPVMDQMIYVGLSRARHHAVVIGQLPEPHSSDIDD